MTTPKAASPPDVQTGRGDLRVLNVADRIIRLGMNTVLITVVVGGNALFNVLLIPPLGMYGAAAATAVAYVLEAVPLVALSRKLFGVTI